jgi:hypothetical protein
MPGAMSAPRAWAKVLLGGFRHEGTENMYVTMLELEHLNL